MSGERIPTEAQVAASGAIDRARDLGHRPQVDHWRQLYFKVFGTTCQRCQRGVWIVSSHLTWISWWCGAG
jgi:hypothetical protein